MDSQMMIEALPQYLQAMVLTLKLASGGILLALLIGMTISLISFFSLPFLKQVTSGYVAISRNTPLLIQLFFLYYGLPRIGIRLEKKLLV